LARADGGASAVREYVFSRYQVFRLMLSNPASCKSRWLRALATITFNSLANLYDVARKAFAATLPQQDPQFEVLIPILIHFSTPALHRRRRPSDLDATADWMKSTFARAIPKLLRGSPHPARSPDQPDECQSYRPSGTYALPAPVVGGR
jgi:hypothetical protein